MKVMTVVGTRPELIRLSRVIAVLRSAADHVLVHTGQNYDYELNQVFFDQLEIAPPDHYLEAGPGAASRVIGQILIKVDELLERERPEALLILGDTNSCLAAIAAKKRRVPIFHMEAGNRCFDDRVPEEANRRVVDHLSDINLPYSDLAREHLLAEGIPSQRIVKTGSPMREVLEYYRPGIDRSAILEELELVAGRYFVVSCHREENVDDPSNLRRFVDIVNFLGADFDLPVVVTTHPRTRLRLDAAGLTIHSRVRLLKPLGFLDYVHLQELAHTVLSDSGTITEESSILNFPALNLRDAHERPEGMEEGAVIMTGLSQRRVTEALAVTATQGRGETRTLHPVEDYRWGNVSQKVLRVILSYTDHVRRFRWLEPV